MAESATLARRGRVGNSQRRQRPERSASRTISPRMPAPGGARWSIAGAELSRGQSQIASGRMVRVDAHECAITCPRRNDAVAARRL